MPARPDPLMKRTGLMPALAGILGFGACTRRGRESDDDPSATPGQTGARPPPATPAEVDAASLRLILAHGSDVIMRLDANWNRLFVSPSCADVFGFDAREVMEAPTLSLVHPEDRTAVRAVLSGLGLPGLTGRATWRAIHRDGRVLWIEATYRRVEEDGGAVVMMRDITQRKVTEDRLRDARARLDRLTRIDPVTGLPNQEAFLDAAAAILAAEPELALLLIDLKPGPAFEGAPETIAKRLGQELIREPLLARLGPWRFAALIRASNGDPGISARARDLIRTIQEPPSDARTPAPECAIGIAVGPRDGTEIAILLRAAGLAATHARGGYRFHEPVMGAMRDRSDSLTRDLPRAIAAGEIVPWLQPAIRLETMAIAAYDILPRWEHPGLGALEAAEFVPLAHAAGATQDLLAVLLERAVQTDHDRMPETLLSLPLTEDGWAEPGLPGRLADVLSRTGFDPTRLELSITEGALPPTPGEARERLTALRGLGVSLMLDDFGTGSSSLACLRDLPFDKIRLGVAAIRGLGVNPEKERYVAAIIGLSHALGLEVTAAGIEDETTLARLRAHGCTFGQGPVFQRPVLIAARMAETGTSRA